MKQQIGTGPTEFVFAMAQYADQWRKAHPLREGNVIAFPRPAADPSGGAS